MWVSVCVRGWVAKEGILSSASLTGVRASRVTTLSNLALRSHKEQCPQKPTKPEEKDEERLSVQSQESVCQE